MHELSIAMCIIDAAAEEAARRGATRVNAVHLKVGALSGVVKDALLFSYGVACDGTLLEGSQLIIEDVPVTVFCSECREQRTVASIQRICCPACGAPTNKVVEGTELQVVAMEIEGVTDPAGTDGRVSNESQQETGS